MLFIVDVEKCELIPQEFHSGLTMSNIDSFGLMSYTFTRFLLILFRVLKRKWISLNIKLHVKHKTELQLP